MPAHELRDRRVALADLWPAATVRRLTEQIGLVGRGAALELVAAWRWRDRARPDPRIAAIVAGLDAGASVAAVAHRVGLGQRQLHRR